MKTIAGEAFKKSTKRLDPFLKIKVNKQVQKISQNPYIGKPLRYKHNERSLYVKPFRLIYSYDEEKDILYLLKFEHRKNVYDFILSIFCYVPENFKV
ncbi:type II toxin-antitoxin system RelE/ParE family toxin [Candidatus Woesearchaeota archaeon]|nr:type II toxin-antitoxin system RelE/ParE family toxin [Candidatus Woesearchaeota archaeon]MCF7900913.1 type II toxin-antitoxin system RelE/ParE family toxin [Candidatus Woesearchaeota archaeon]MCF8013038.1 type II toxin-antitoxin system RelE/ParE family toxin [Candidatus Woesearchaeota archaeon]